jgi:GT2 family glycosyltransferase
MELSIIIVNYNVRHFLEQCLFSVRKATKNIPCEIIVVDNNSADGSCSMVKKSFPEVKLIRNEKNQGFAVANNQAIRIATGKYILLLNPDTIVEEDTFSKCITFMNNHPDAGSVGVKMIDGKGKYLPESKRALPTPKVAFFKIFGFATLFPESPKFNRYYMGYLDKDETNPVDILTGAFMFLRKDALNKTGLLDENFFMYGEDIDLSYRLMKAGFKNYYYPDVTIVHYKGQSTKKGNINYIIHFYKAMLIFLMKHYTGPGQKVYLMLIKAAICFRASISLLKRLVRIMILPVFDATIIGSIYILLIDLWQQHHFSSQYSYPDVLKYIIVPIYIFIWIIAIAAFGGYKRPAKISRLISGTICGTAIILVVYALLPNDIRFSRALILFGGFSASIFLPLFRYLLLIAGFEIILNPFSKYKRTIIASNEVEYSYIANQLTESSDKYNVIGRVTIKTNDFGYDTLGDVQQIKEIVKFNKIDTVIFSSRELNASQIIHSMMLLSDENLEIIIAPTDGKYFIGGNSKLQSGDFISIGLPRLKRKKTWRSCFLIS